MGPFFSPRFGQAILGSAITPQILSEFSNWETSYPQQNNFTLNLLKTELGLSFPTKISSFMDEDCQRSCVFFGSNTETPGGSSGLLCFRPSLMSLPGEDSHQLLLDYSTHRDHVRFQKFCRENIISGSYTLRIAGFLEHACRSKLIFQI